MRPIASASISFGMVSIPVKLFSSADTSSAVSFNRLHKECGSRLKQQYICSKGCGVIPREDMIKGYQFARDQYVTLTDEEIKALEAVKSETIDIVEFVPLETVDRINLEKVYFLSPGKGGDRPYRLLSIALQRTGKAGIARYAARGKGYLVMIRPMGDGLAMEQLHYADDLRSFDEVEVPDVDVKDAEVDLAIQIIEQVSVEDYDPTKYNDEVKEKVLEQIQQKIDGKEVIEMPQEPAEEKIVDLMDALKASLANKGAKAEEKPVASAARSRRKKAAK
ncbi:MAG: Ku protein [Pseudomonadota bacterium]